VEPDRASWTARSAAYLRAYHCAHDSPRVFEDLLAGTLTLGFELLEDLDHEAQEARYFVGRADGLRPVKFAHFVHAQTRRAHHSPMA
jgi:hypothetical protein